MALSFDGSAHQYVGTAAGAIGPAGVGDYTIVTLYQPSGDSTAVSLCSGSLSGTIEREIVNDNDGSGNKWYGDADFTGFGSWTTNTWYLVGQSKAAGTNSYHWQTWPYVADGSGTKTHSDGPGTHGDGAAIAGIRIGDGDDKGRGSVALVAVWNRVLSDADFDALCGNTAQAFMDLPSGAPNALLLCNVAAPGDVVDVTGSGADAVTVVGSGITIGADPPSFNYTVTQPTSVRFDAVGPSSIGLNSAFDLTWSHTCSGANRAVVVGLTYTDQDPISRPLTATFGGVTMTKLGVVESNNAGNGFVTLFGLVNPPAGTSTVDVTDDTGGGHKMIGGSISFNGVDQTTPFGVTVTGAGDNSSGSDPPSVTVNSGTNDMVVDAICYGSAIDGANQTLRWMDNVSDSISAAGNAAQSTAPGASSVTMSYAPTLHDWWGMVAVNIKAVATPWLQRTVLSGASIAQNGTINHTVTFTPATSGDLLIAVMNGAVTFTTPTGWTLVNDAATSNGLYVFSKVAASGESSFTTSHGIGNSNYPILGVIYEFPAGTTVLSSNEDHSMATTATTPTLTGLTGTYITFAARGWTMAPGTVTSASASWTTPTIKDYDAFVLNGGSPAQDGTAVSIAYNTNQTGATFTPSSVYSFNGTGAGAGTNGAGVSWAVQLGVISTNNGAGMLLLVGL